MFKRNLHVISLFVFRADGLPWPARALTEETARGFNVLLWRAGELGYCLTSDVNRAELQNLARKLGALTTTPPTP